MIRNCRISSRKPEYASGCLSQVSRCALVFFHVQGSPQINGQTAHSHFFPWELVVLNLGSAEWKLRLKVSGCLILQGGPAEFHIYMGTAELSHQTLPTKTYNICTYCIVVTILRVSKGQKWMPPSKTHDWFPGSSSDWSHVPGNPFLRQKGHLCPGVFAEGVPAVEQRAPWLP